jgi:hypothetical protein
MSTKAQEIDTMDLTSSRHIGHRLSLSFVAQSLYVACGREVMTCSGSPRGLASPNVLARDNRFS